MVAIAASQSDIDIFIVRHIVIIIIIYIYGMYGGETNIHVK